MPSLVAARFGTILVSVHDAVPMSDEAWEGNLSLAREILKDVGGDAGKIQVLTFTDGGPPTSIQRNRLREVMNHQAAAAVAIVSDALSVRAAIGILGIFFTGTRGFHPRNWRAAFREVGVPPDRDEELRRLLRELRTRVGKVRSLEPMLDEPDEVGRARSA